MLRVDVPSRTVYVADIPRAECPLEESTVGASLARLTDGPVEACADMDAAAIACEYHAFIAALHAAFADHRPLVLSPDMFWLLIAQGIARIVNLDPEAMRDRFVSHAGKINVEIRRDEFVIGSSENDWPGVFRAFSDAIREHVGIENYETLVTTFSTTGPIERAANEIVFLDAMQSYFDLVVSTVCGIPEITLEGTHQDWLQLAEQARVVRDRYDCAWWLDHVVPLLDRVAAAAGGAEDPGLWNSIYKWKSTSFGPLAGGWIVQFFPYLGRPSSGGRRNHLLGLHCEELGIVEFTRDGRQTTALVGLTSDDWPSGLSRAPFVWEYHAKRLAMQFIAGFTHCTQDPQTLAVRPAIGWAVRPTPGAGGPGLLQRILGAFGWRTPRSP